MSKYIIDIPDGFEWGVVTCRTEDGFYTRDFDFLEELNSDYINEHYGESQDEAYQAGLNDAWEAAKKLYLNGACKDLFGEYFNTFIKNHTAQEAIDKIKSYEDDNHSDRIEVGDEVIYNGVTKCVVVTPETDVRYASLFDCNGIHYSADHRKCKKTGKHYDIASILEAMRNDR